MKLLHALTIVAPLMMSGTALAKAGHVHNHENAVEPPPHGGTLRDCPPYKAEAVITGETVKVYLYDKNLKPLKPERPTADAEVEMPKKKAREFKFKKNGDYYVAKVPGISKAHRYDLVVEFYMKGKPILVDFGVDNIDR